MRKQTLLIASVSLVMLFSLLPISALAANGSHDEGCAYRAGTPCNHVHDEEECYYLTEPDDPTCNHEHSDACGVDYVDCPHVHSVDCGYFIRELQCPHVHDADCGYSPAVPCTCADTEPDPQPDPQPATNDFDDSHEPDEPDPSPLSPEDYVLQETNSTGAGGVPAHFGFNERVVLQSQLENMGAPAAKRFEREADGSLAVEFDAADVKKTSLSSTGKAILLSSVAPTAVDRPKTVKAEMTKVGDITTINNLRKKGSQTIKIIIPDTLSQRDLQIGEQQITQTSGREAIKEGLLPLQEEGALKKGQEAIQEAIQQLEQEVQRRAAQVGAQEGTQVVSNQGIVDVKGSGIGQSYNEGEVKLLATQGAWESTEVGTSIEVFYNEDGCWLATDGNKLKNADTAIALVPIANQVVDADTDPNGFYVSYNVAGAKKGDTVMVWQYVN